MYEYIYSCMLCVFLCSFSSLFILATIIDRSKRCATIYAIYAGVRSSLPEEDASSSSSAPDGSGDVRSRSSPATIALSRSVSRADCPYSRRSWQDPCVL